LKKTAKIFSSKKAFIYTVLLVLEKHVSSWIF